MPNGASPRATSVSAAGDIGADGHQALLALGDQLDEVAAAGATVLFSSHQLDLVQDLCEDVVMLHLGRTVLEGRVSDLRASAGRRRLR